MSIVPGTSMTAKQLHGIVPALITPLDEQGDVDEVSVHALIDFQVAAGRARAARAGLDGRRPLLSTEQKLRMVRATVEAARGRIR